MVLRFVEKEYACADKAFAVRQRGMFATNGALVFMFSENPASPPGVCNLPRNTM